MCPVFIGRAPERDALHRLIDQTRSGQGQVALVCGEAGIGKSRLVAQAKAYAAEQDFLLLQGSCFQLDRSYPFAPLLDLLRASAAVIPFATDLSPVILEFARLLPELALSLTGPLPVPLTDPEQEKRRLFVALTRYFQQKASQRPLLLVIEDLHWCDDISLEFLQSLARHCSTHPLLLLMTYRSDEVQPSLQRCLAQLDRARLSQDLQLAPLPQSDVEAMLGAMFALPNLEQSNLMELIYPLSEGNPFFVEEMLTSLVSRGELVFEDGVWRHKPQLDHRSERVPVPRSVQDTVQQRTYQLSGEAMQVVTYAAVSGRRFDFAVLRQVMQCDEGRLLLLIKELVAIQLVVELSVEQFAFRHALTQQAVYTGLLARERRSLHRALAEAIEQLYATTPLLDAHLEDLASHYYGAEVWSKALYYEQLVGEKALAIYAPQAALDHFTHALTALQHLSGMQPSPVYRLRGQAYETLGEFERALADYEQALEAARAGEDRQMELESMMALGFLWTGRDYEQAGGWFRCANDLAERLADPALRARSLNRLGNWLVNTGRTQEGLEAHQQALQLFEARADTQGMAETLDLLGVAYSFYGDTAAAVKHLGQAVDLFRRLGNSQSLLSSLTSRALDSAPEHSETTFSSLRTRDECLQDTQEALRLARETHSLAGQAFVEFVTTQIWSSFGEFGRALSHAQEALRIATTIEHQQWTVATYGALGQLYLLMLEPVQAILAIDAGLAVAQTLGSAFWINDLTSYLALSYIQRHELPRAEAVLTAIMPREYQPGNLGERQVARAWGELALAQGESAVALRIAEQLILSAPGSVRQPIPHLLALKGDALMTLQRLEEAALVLEDAKLGAEQRGALSVLSRILSSLGQAYHRLRREDQAEREFVAAREIITVLAGTIEETHLREHFVQAALLSLPPAKPRSRRTASEKFGGLTQREREVLRYVARGLTDIQVAEQLVISPRTVNSHLNSIYSKLGITSRSAATRYAIEHDLG
jgi:DNA-binding CsgD family transcriptional regulator/tetratricopeptide (TPR) repeat protein